MQIKQAYKFRLQLKKEQEVSMRKFAGCCRFIWNWALASEKENYETNKKRLGFKMLSRSLPGLKKSEDTSFLAEASAQILQQTLKDLDRAYKNFFFKKSRFPKVQEKGKTRCLPVSAKI